MRKSGSRVKISPAPSSSDRRTRQASASDMGRVAPHAARVYAKDGTKVLGPTPQRLILFSTIQILPSPSAFQERQQAADLVQRQRLAIQHNLDQRRGEGAEHRSVAWSQIVQVNFHRLGAGAQFFGFARVSLVGQQFRAGGRVDADAQRSEEHTSELQSL